jgi:hypothetical protein
MVRERPDPAEQERALKEAEAELKKAGTAEDVRRIWRKHYLTVGHRKLGRLLLGRSAAELMARSEAKE